MATANPQRPVIVHPTDFAPGDAAAMAHAVAMALASKSILRLLQVRIDNELFYSPTQGLRQVRDLLALGPLCPLWTYPETYQRSDSGIAPIFIAEAVSCAQDHKKERTLREETSESSLKVLSRF